MKILQKLNITAIIAVLCAFCFATALSADTTVALRGSDSDGNRRNLQYEKVSIFRCDSENRTISSTITNETQYVEEDGLDIRVCFKVTPRASSDDLFILKIDDFSFTKGRVSGDMAAAGPTRQIPVIMRQNAVDHGLEMSPEVTTIYCDPGASVCAIETRLTGYFFLTNGVIKGRGSVAMQRGRDEDEGRALMPLDGFEDVSINLEFTGGGNGIGPETSTMIVIIGIIIALLVLFCLCGFACCLFGVCCFAYRNKKETEESEEENIEEVSVRIEFDPAVSKKSKKRDEDESETESLEDDQYWDDEAGMADYDSDDRTRSEGNSAEGFDNFDNEMNGAALVPVPETDEESPQKESKRMSKRSSQRSSKMSSQRDSQRGSRRDSQRGSRRGSQRSSQRSSKMSSQRDSQRSSQRSSKMSSQRDSQRGSQRGSQRSSQRSSQRNKSVEDNESWIDNSEDGIEPVDRSSENHDVENNMEEVVPVEDAEEEHVPVEDTEEEPQKRRKSRRQSKRTSKRIN